jgi:hypothetical protein
VQEFEERFTVTHALQSFDGDNIVCIGWHVIPLLTGVNCALAGRNVCVVALFQGDCPSQTNYCPSGNFCY